MHPQQVSIVKDLGLLIAEVHWTQYTALYYTAQLSTVVYYTVYSVQKRALYTINLINKATVS